MLRLKLDGTNLLHVRLYVPQGLAVTLDSPLPVTVMPHEGTHASLRVDFPVSAAGQSSCSFDLIQEKTPGDLLKREKVCSSPAADPPDDDPPPDEDPDGAGGEIPPEDPSLPPVPKDFFDKNQVKNYLDTLYFDLEQDAPQKEPSLSAGKP